MNAPAPVQAPAPDPRPAIRRMKIDDILGLRRLTLGYESPPAPPDPQYDRQANTWHMGLFGRPYQDRRDETRLIACVTYVFDPYPGPEGKVLAWRMHSLAALQSADIPSVRKELLVPAERAVATESNVRLFWSRARILDRPLLEELGWKAALDRPTEYIEGIRILMLKEWKPVADRN